MRLNWFSDLPLLLNMSITGTVVILFVLLFRLILKKAPKKIVSVLWLIVLFRLLCPVAPMSDMSLMGALEKAQIKTEIQTQTEQKQAELQPTPIISDVSVPAAPQTWESVRGQLFEKPTQMPLPTADGAAMQTQKPDVQPDWLFIVWAAGAAVMVMCSILSLLRLRRKLIGAVKLRENIYLADHIETPFVLGILRPRIMLPSALSEQEQDYIILHEKTHIRRLDHVRKLLHFAALCIHWFNPFVWLSFVLAGQDMEMACDEQVLGTLGTQIRADYSGSLLRLATGHRIFAGAPLAFGEGNPKGRIRHVLNWKKPALWIIVLALIVAGSAAIVLGTNPIAMEPPIGSAYQAEKLLYEAPNYHSGQMLQEMPIYALDGSGVLYKQNDTEDQIWSRIGETEQVSLSTAELCAMYSPGSAKVYAKMAGVRTAWRVLADGQKFYLLMQTNYDVLMAVGYGEGETSRIRWLYRLDRLGKYLPLQEMIEQNVQIKDAELFAAFSADTMQAVVYGFQYDGGMGTAAFGYDETGMPTKFLDCEAFSGSDIYCMTAARRQYSDCIYTVVLSENEALSRVTAQYGDCFMEQESLSCPSMIVFVWPEEPSEEESFHPEMHYYDTEGNELFPEEGVVKADSDTWAEGRSLTQAELDAWNERLQFAIPDPDHDGKYTVNPLCLFFFCEFDKPENIDLERFCRYFPEDREPITEREFSLLKQDPYWPFANAKNVNELPAPIHRHPASDIEAMLRKYTDIGLRDLQETPESLPGLLYLPEFDAYYNFTSDAGLTDFTCTSGWQYGNVMTLFGVCQPNTQSTLVLWESDGEIKLLSHEIQKNVISENPVPGYFDGVTAGMTMEQLSTLGYDVSEAEGTVAGFRADHPDEVVLEMYLPGLQYQRLRKDFRLTEEKLEPLTDVWQFADRPQYTLKRELAVSSEKGSVLLQPGSAIVMLFAEQTENGWRIWYADAASELSGNDGYFDAAKPDGNGCLIIDGISTARIFEDYYGGAYLSNGVRLGMTVDEVMALTGEFELQKMEDGLGAYGTHENQTYTFWRDDDDECWLSRMVLRDFEKTDVTACGAAFAPGQTLTEVLRKLGIRDELQIPPISNNQVEVFYDADGIQMGVSSQSLTISVQEQSYNVSIILYRDAGTYTVSSVYVRWGGKP